MESAMISLSSPSLQGTQKPVAAWLFLVALLIAAMVMLGGLTRLTGSGLSITEWHPVTGVIPPLDQQAWAQEFAKYQRIPQYRLEHPDMSLTDFKAIYWWEWSHRLLGRLLGVAFFLPFLFFAATGAISRKDWPRMLGLFALGGLQGLVGWWMVKSGLETRVSVSQYRLAIHLGVAVILLGAILWTALDYWRGRDAAAERSFFLPPSASLALGAFPHKGGRYPGDALTICALAFIALVYLQILLGALVAGLHAGLIYNTWPSMDGRAFPEHPFFGHPWWANFGENAGLAQLDHRIGAYIVALCAFALWLAGQRAKLSGAARTSSNAVPIVTASQVVLGIVTLLNQAPLHLAVTHQAVAITLYATAVWHAHNLRCRAAPVDQAAASA
jgi:cytochrome c oxidase assembly protein subunit 15